MFKFSCLQCIYKNSATSKCKIHNISIDKSNRCSLFSDEAKYCKICRQLLILKPNLIYFPSTEKWEYVCENCRRQILGTCRTCENSARCVFKEDTTMPNFVVETVQNGSVRQQFQIKNPSKIDKFCKEKCLCFSQEFGCQRETNYCINHKEII